MVLGGNLKTFVVNLAIAEVPIYSRPSIIGNNKVYSIRGKTVTQQAVVSQGVMEHLRHHRLYVWHAAWLYI